jgi:tungstate transport system ATP-binding protein
VKIVAHEIRKKYQDNLVLDINSISFKEGEITGITGPNGSGKTTLLNIIAGLDPNFDGNVIYSGETLDIKIMRNMTLVFQKPYLFRRSVFENIAYPMILRKEKSETINEKVDEIARLLEIEDLLDKKGHQLSGGETQKVALARAIIFRPSVLLLDEATSSLDPASVQTIEEAIKRYNYETGATVIVITHNIEQSNRLCDNIISLELGKVV